MITSTSFSRAVLLFFLTAISIHHILAEEAKAIPPLSPFPDGTKYAAVGDSITHGGFYLYFINFYYATRSPHQKLILHNCGYNGEAAWQLLKRYPFDVATLHPDVVSLMYGMNDGGLAFYEKDAKFAEPLPVLKARAIDSYEKSIRQVIQRVLQDGSQVILMTPTPYDDTSAMKSLNRTGYNAALKEISVRAKEVANDLGVPFVDLYTPLQKINEEQQKKNPAFTIVGIDRIHPGPMGHIVMTYAFLKAQNAPADVAGFSIDGATGMARSTTNCEIDEVKFENGALTFRYSAGAIPFVAQNWYSSAMKWVPFADELNREIFQVTNLPSGNYELQMDGVSIRTYTSQELAAGVNVSAESKTPEYQQSLRALNVYAGQFSTYARLRDIVTRECRLIDLKIPRPLSVEQTNQLLDNYLRSKTGTPQEEKARKEVEALRDLKSHEAEYRAAIDRAVEEVHRLVQPKAHVVKITPSR